MSAVIFQSVASTVATGNQFSASGVYYAIASGIDQFISLLDMLPQPARRAFSAHNPMVRREAGAYPTLRVIGRSDTDIDADVSALMSGSRPTRVIAMRLADGSYLFAGTAK